MSKPSSGLNSGHIEWKPIDSADIIEPSIINKGIGFKPEQYPPSQWLNWFWNKVTLWLNYFGGVTEDAVVIGGDTYESDALATGTALQAAITDASTGDVIYIKEDIILTSVLNITSSIKIKIKNGVKFYMSTASTNVLNITANNVTIEGFLDIQMNQIGTCVKCISITGSNCKIENLSITNTSGTVTSGIYLEVGCVGALINGLVTGNIINITNIINDNSGYTNNLISIREV